MLLCYYFDEKGTFEKMYGDLLKRHREFRGYTLEHVASLAGTTAASVQRWESAEYPKLEAVVKCCSIYGISLSDFFRADKDIPAEYIIMIKDVLSLPQEWKEKILMDIRNDLKFFVEKVNVSAEQKNLFE